ncbi:hypothetical protein [Thalassobaculum sp.]|uniref:hypothetical protein n=1 Tax=Thalassobaculum sp. TaxID=2022740 RepID=UPI0032F098C5
MTSAFEATYWNLLQALAWIHLDDVDLIERAGDESLAREMRPNVMSLTMADASFVRRYPSLTSAIAALRARLEAGDLEAIGLVEGRGDPKPIPAVYWTAGQLTFEPEAARPVPLHRIGGTTWTQLRFRSDQVQELWPPMPDNASSLPGFELQALVIAQRWAADQPDQEIDVEILGEAIVAAAISERLFRRTLDVDALVGFEPNAPVAVPAIGPDGQPRSPLEAVEFARSFRAIPIDVSKFVRWLQGDAGGEWMHSHGLSFPGFLQAVPAVEGGDSATTPPTVRGETRCEEWLCKLMVNEPIMAKGGYQIEAIRQFNVSRRGFARAWANAINRTGNETWSKPGRKSTRGNRIAN